MKNMQTVEIILKSCVTIAHTITFGMNLNNDCMRFAEIFNIGVTMTDFM